MQPRLIDPTLMWQVRVSVCWLLYGMGSGLVGDGSLARHPTRSPPRTHRLSQRPPPLAPPSPDPQVGTAESRKPALRLNVERLKDEGVDNWAAFERRYLVVERR